MHKTITIAIVAMTLMATTGCGSGPIGRFFRGGACNTCQPATGQSLWSRWSGNTNCANGAYSEGDVIPDGGVLPGPAQTQPDAFGIDPNSSGVIYGHPSYDPFSTAPLAPSTSPSTTTNVLPGPR